MRHYPRSPNQTETLPSSGKSAAFAPNPTLGAFPSDRPESDTHQSCTSLRELPEAGGVEAQTQDGCGWIAYKKPSSGIVAQWRDSSLRNRVDTQGEDVRNRVDAQGKEMGEQIGQLRERMAHLEGLLKGLREAITGKRMA